MTRIEYNRTYQDTAYLKCLQEVLNHGFKVMDRTGTGTIGINGYHMEFDMSRHSYYNDGDLIIDNFPLLTTKKMFTKGIFEELLWFLRGETNIKSLVDKGINIWNDWPLKAYNKHRLETNQVPVKMEEFVNNIKESPAFAKEFGELGPVYGKQWVKWEASKTKFVYKDDTKNKTYTLHINQIENLVRDLKANPFSRRHIVTAWNPADIEEMVVSGLPPCHLMFQCLVRPCLEGDEGYNYLDMKLDIRSNDLFLGAPFNIASYALLLALFAKEVGMLPGKLSYHVGSAHIYLNHIDQVKEQLTREPFRSPTLTIGVGGSVLDDSYKLEDFVISNYESHASIKGEIAV